MNEQCHGITKAGARCRITRNLVDGYCPLHRNQAVGQHSDLSQQPEAPVPTNPAVPQSVRAVGAPDVEFDERPYSSATPITLGMAVVAAFILAVIALLVGRHRARR